MTRRRSSSEDLSTTQQPPRPGDGWAHHGNWVLRAWLERAVPEDLLEAHRPVLAELGRRSGAEWYDLQLADRLNEPRLTQWSAWGERIDSIELTPLWQRAHRWAAEYGLVATGYDDSLGEHARLLQFARAWMYIPSTDFYGCPLAMTDGAARVLADAGNEELASRALPHLLSTDPGTFWTSGQWMTETVGGSDVGRTETVARQDEDGTWRLTGRKWFTSAATSEIALTLARPQGDGERAEDGSRGLALFYLEPRDDEGRLRNIEILRLKDKLGTRKLPTAELWLDGVPAQPVAGLERGVASIAPMLNITRTWNAVTACALMQRALALADDYAGKREAFGKPLAELPLHRETLADLEADRAAASCALLSTIDLLGVVEHQGGTSESSDRAALRLLTPLIKLGTARDAVAVVSEALEAIGGAGYIEDTGIPQLLRDVQVLSIWEGTTNVLSLDALRAIAAVGIDPWLDRLQQRLDGCRQPALAGRVDRARDALSAVPGWLEPGPEALEPQARRLALNLYRLTGLVELLGLADHWLARDDDRPLAVARHYQDLRFRLEPLRGR
ncbi:acyl-CoA dehydrogenase family protein [Halomonas denitrificans]|nr:acyl-CoA dehydrogenase family protein [Halomonas denitrificans]